MNDFINEILKMDTVNIQINEGVNMYVSNDEDFEETRIRKIHRCSIFFGVPYYYSKLNNGCDTEWKYAKSIPYVKVTRSQIAKALGVLNFEIIPDDKATEHTED